MSKKHKKTLAQRKKVFPVLMFFTCSAILILIGAINLTRIRSKASVDQIAETKSPYTESELHIFWDSKLKTIIADECMGMKLSYPELNEHMGIMTQKIIDRTGTNIHLRLEPEYHEFSPRVLAASGTDKKTGQAEIQIFVPAMFDEFRRLNVLHRPDEKEIFKTDIIIVIMHEMEHLVYNSPEIGVTNDIEEESRAWYDTFSYTVVPLYEKYHMPISNNQIALYKAWKTASGDANSPVWKDAIKRAYQPIEGKVIKK